MLKGLLKIFEPGELDLLHRGVLEVLERTGLRIQGEFLLRALADAGCRVDFGQRRAWFPPDLVERQIGAQRGRYKMVRSSLWYPFCRSLPEDDVSVPPEFVVDYGYATPWIYDHPQRRYRKPTAQDQVEMIRLGNALPCVKAVNAPLIVSEFDPRVETIESARLLLMNTAKPGWVGTSSAAEVKHLAELACLAVGGEQQHLRTEPPIFVAAYCTTSPLKVDSRSCDVLQEALKYGFPVNFAPMPILGATSPMTPAGAAIVAAAEILGSITATSLIAPDLYYFSTSIAGEMDMRTTQVCYSTPAAILTDAALHQLFRYRYGMVHNVEPGYVEAKAPGMQAAFMKTFRQMAFGSTASLPLGIGVLDNAAVFSPTQAMIDLDMNEALYKFARGTVVNAETCALELIHELVFCERRTYLESEHTLAHFRNVGWHPRLFDRTYCDHTKPVGDGDQKLLDQADRAWRKLVAEQEPLVVDSALAREIDRIVEAARKDLLDDELRPD
jgi:trimethylamine--corrinoid protein Co-methyltransferase